MQNYNMAELSAELGSQPGFFLTRENGERAYSLLRTRLEQIPDRQGLLLIFPPEQLVDASFADETIVRLGEELTDNQLGDRVLLLLGLTEDSIKNIEAVIGFRRLKLGFLVVERNDRWRCIGQLDPSLLEVLKLLAERDHLTAPELAEMLNLAINTASNRLKRLYDRRLVRREYEVSAKGLQYFYFFWEWRDLETQCADLSMNTGD